MISSFLLTLKAYGHYPLIHSLFISYAQNIPHLWVDLTAIDEVLSANAWKPSWVSRKLVTYSWGSRAREENKVKKEWWERQGGDGRGQTGWGGRFLFWYNQQELHGRQAVVGVDWSMVERLPDNSPKEEQGLEKGVTFHPQAPSTNSLETQCLITLWS